MLSYLDYAPWVAIVSATAGAASSWMAFEDLQQRLLRYTRTVRSLEKLLAWWSTQSGGALNGASITRLVQTGEQIITSERLAWATIAKEEDVTKDREGAAAQQGGKPAQSGGGGGSGGGGQPDLTA